MIYWDYSPISSVLTTWNRNRLQFPAQSRLCSSLGWAGASERVRLADGAQACNQRLCDPSPRYKKASCLCPQPGGPSVCNQHVCALCTPSRRWEGPRDQACTSLREDGETAELLPSAVSTQGSAAQACSPLPHLACAHPWRPGKDQAEMMIQGEDGRDVHTFSPKFSPQLCPT